MNLADSHDTDRIVSKMFNPDRSFDGQNREQNDDSYNGSKPNDECYQKARLMALLQVTYLGAPMVYYGDEAGMWGSDDPNNRKPMLWKDLEPYEEPESNQVMENHLAFYSSALALRKNHSALRNGSFGTVFTDDQRNTWVFMRENDEEQVLVILNASGAEITIDLPDLGEGWAPVFGEGDDVPPSVGIHPLAGRVWARPK